MNNLSKKRSKIEAVAVMRTKSFIYHSDEKHVPNIDEKGATSTTIFKKPGKRVRPKEDDLYPTTKDEIHPAKKMRLIVELEDRVGEKMANYKSAFNPNRINIYQRRAFPMIHHWMERSRLIQNRQQHSSEFAAKKCQPCMEESPRSSMIANFNELQITKGSRLKHLIAEYIYQNSIGQRGRLVLVRILNMLPNCIEARHLFFTYYLPRARVEFRRKNDKKRQEHENETERKH